MKRLVIFMAITLLILSCSESNDSPNKYENLCFYVYDVDSEKPIANVTLTLTRLSDKQGISSQNTDTNGNCCFSQLKAGNYSVNAVKYGYESASIPNTSQITNRDDGSIPIPMKLLSDNMDDELIVELTKDTLDFGSQAPFLPFSFKNPYINDTIEWNIVLPDTEEDAWVTGVDISNGKLYPAGSSGRRDMATVVVSVNRNKMRPGLEKDESSIVIKSGGKGATLILRIEQSVTFPQKAIITGDNTNTCPSKTVMLKVNAEGATSYKWFMGSTLLSNANGSEYEVKYNGTYYAVGVNSKGDGTKSSGHSVNINTCPDPPARATISSSPYNAVNNCDESGQSVTLTASAERATSYIWLKGTDTLDETKNRLLVNSVGTYMYYAQGVNVSGVGQESYGKQVTINSCAPGNPTSVSVDDAGGTTWVKISWGTVIAATSYKVQICDNINMNGCESSAYYKEADFTNIYFDESELYCGMNYFKVIAVNEFGESSGTTKAYNRVADISAPSLSYQYGSLHWHYVNIKGVSSTTIYYDVYRKIGNGEWTFIATTTGFSYTDDYSSKTETVYYKIRAYANTVCGMVEKYSGIESY